MGWIMAYMAGLGISFAIIHKIYKIGVWNGREFNGMGRTMMLVFWPILMPILFRMSRRGIIKGIFGED